MQNHGTPVLLPPVPTPDHDWPNEIAMIAVAERLVS